MLSQPMPPHTSLVLDFDSPTPEQLVNFERIYNDVKLNPDRKEEIYTEYFSQRLAEAKLFKAYCYKKTALNNVSPIPSPIVASRSVKLERTPPVSVRQLEELADVRVMKAEAGDQLGPLPVLASTRRRSTLRAQSLFIGANRGSIGDALDRTTSNPVVSLERKASSLVVPHPPAYPKPPRPKSAASEVIPVPVAFIFPSTPSPSSRAEHSRNSRSTPSPEMKTFSSSSRTLDL